MATQASTQGCIRIASAKIQPDSKHDARDLFWQAASAFDAFIGYSVLYYDTPERTVEEASSDLRACGENLRQQRDGPS